MMYQYGLIGRRFLKYGFACVYSDEEGESYYLRTGKYTALIIDGKYEPHEEYDEEMYYDFYKQCFHPRHSKCVTYCEHLDSVHLMKRVERYFKNRESFIKQQDDNRNYLKNKKE